ncbi:PQQ-dependent sugar dehydrogenase [Phenylobacterium sp. LjRoot225]|uniref:PQQ-dependent sugar dehydrogenase n=1 Tax=Phenylobacterium sp. LjRoot225 TaxID=3342285 RepID=UPI003F4F9FF6
MRWTMLASLAALLTACGGSNGQAQTQGAEGGAPVQTGRANAADQTPAVPGQTRAPEVRSNVAYQVTTYVDGLEEPWGLAFLPNGGLLISEKPGRLRIFEAGKLSPAVAGLPAIDARGQGGLLGLAIDPQYARNGLIYFAFSEPDGDANHTAVGRGRLARSPGAPPKLDDVRVIWRQKPSLSSTAHFGARLVFARDGTLFITTGERSIIAGRMQAQRLDSGLGKVMRINADGSIPRDNPFVGRAGAQPEIYSTGHRNIQAATLNPRTGELWEVEHGTRGGDEVNVVRAGRDYGWPTIAYGREYAGGQITGGVTQKAGLEQPVYYWDPVIAPSGMAFYEASLFPAWKGSLFVGGLKDKRLTRLVLDGDRVVGEERLLGEVDERVRDVIVGPDGALYVATDNDRGRVLKLAPR